MKRVQFSADRGTGEFHSILLKIRKLCYLKRKFYSMLNCHNEVVFLFLYQLRPPFKPEIKSEADTANFDPEFTTETPRLTPPDKSGLWMFKYSCQSVFCNLSFETNIL